MPVTLPPEISLVVLSGKAQTGKDFIEREYFRPLGYRAVSLALIGKSWMVGRGPYSHEELYGAKTKESRDALQHTLDGERLMERDAIWVDATLSLIRQLHDTWGETRFLIPDLRHPGDMERLKDAGAQLFRIWAPDRALASDLTPEQRRHYSEIALDQYDPQIDAFNGQLLPSKLEGFDALIDNRAHLWESLDYQLTQACRVLDIIPPTATLQSATLAQRRAGLDAALADALQAVQEDNAEYFRHIITPSA
jgi:hypothetical protein